MTYKQALKECEVFAGLSDAELEKVASAAMEKQYDAGATIFKVGDSAEELLVVQDGKVALQMTLPGAQAEMSRRITVDLISRNEVVGWSAIVEPNVYTLTAVCLQNVKALSLSGAKLKGLLRDNPKAGYEILKGLIKVVASRLDDTRQVLVSERLLSGVTRKEATK
ncbi:MAG: cyclic nucleotide-binding domain-containing protein [Chloroflexi bacterium]|nr:cyclic nucleotide-binding domain-containing protein [Chloroflexota bacterium]